MIMGCPDKRLRATEDDGGGEVEEVLQKIRTLSFNTKRLD
jgi:hypothetical protein